MPAEITSYAIPSRRSVQNRFFAGLAIAATTLGLLTATALPARADRESDNMAKALAGLAVIGIIVNDAQKPNRRTPGIQPAQVVMTLPRVCAMPIDGLRHEDTAYAERCLRDEGVNARLPRACAHDVRIGRHRDRVYAENCMLDAGFEIEHYRRRGHHRPNRISPND
ncbi:hypothetical protein [Rhodobacter ferrooxidans]|uniref:Uncharacterized protein n=1 Tax=Rhodobacter ferrooxidans TaxID=371731 RepID=C8RW63_9RHOB|nr:hypothetical protein [Rhodobacter sp. SW2]EEW26806.1 conserved hypothetical protein [Rhodobacter sp. SW2]